MTALAWTEDLRLNQPQMDRTHAEFVELLAVAREAAVADAALALSAFERLLEHTEQHFAQEDRWMLASGFAPGNCHARQHAAVLDVMREVLRLARDEAQHEPLNRLISELGQWFPQHAAMMDAGLALQMAAVGLDPATGVAAAPLPEQALTHCGGASCR